MPRTRSRPPTPKTSPKPSPANDPRTKRGACVKVPSGDRAFVKGIDPTDSGRVQITYEAGLGSDSYPLHMLTLVQESPEVETEPAPITPTVISEADQLAALEQKIQHGIDQIESGKAAIWQAVAEVQAAELWRIGRYASFEDYCKRRWGWEKSNSFEVAAAGRIVGELKESGVPESALPTSVAQARQITKLPKEQRAEVVQKIAESGEKLTAKAIKQAVKPQLQQGDEVTIQADDDLNRCAAIVERVFEVNDLEYAAVYCWELPGACLEYLLSDLRFVASATPGSIEQLKQLRIPPVTLTPQPEVSEPEPVAEPLQLQISDEQRAAERLLVEYKTTIPAVAKKLLSWCDSETLEEISEWLLDEKARRKGYADYEEFADAVQAQFFVKEAS